MTLEFDENSLELRLQWTSVVDLELKSGKSDAVELSDIK